MRPRSSTFSQRWKPTHLCPSFLIASLVQAQKVNEAKVQYLESELEAKTKALLQLNRVSCGHCPARDI